MRPRPRQRRSSRRGYVLLMTLVLIVIAALCQAGLARRSLRLALDSRDAQEDLQRRWFAESCRDLFLKRADELFILAEDAAMHRRPQWPAPHAMSSEFVVDRMHVRLLLADEDAKLNLNALNARQSDQLRATILRLTGGALPLLLHPDPSREAKLRKRTFASWGQVFDLPQVFPQGQGSLFMKATENLSCWGDGKPNIRRAADETLDLAASQALSRDAARQIVGARASFEGDLLLPELLAKLDLRRSDQLKLRGALSDRSSCYSLWLELETDRRRWYYLWVLGDAASGGPPIASFRW